jgi:hypothetical protein
MFGLRWRDFAVWAAYCAMLALAIPWHEPWRDEAQAWLLARELSIPQLLFHALRYESHPILWYLVLWLPTHLHLSYASIGWISGTISAAGVYVLLRWAPFPFYLRAVLPFTFFLAFQFAVVARSYCLFPLLCFLIAQEYRKLHPRPVWMAVLLSLLANISAHGTLVACCFALAYAWMLYRRRAAIALPAKNIVCAAGIFGLAVLLVAIAVRPPADLATVAAPTVTKALRFAGKADASPQTPDQGSPASPTVADESPGADQNAAAAGAPAKGGHLAARLANLPRIFFYSVSSSNLLGLIVYLVLAAFLIVRSQTLLLLPLAVLGLFLGFVYAREWHLGLMWIVLITVAWMAWEPERDRGPVHLQQGLALLLTLVSLLQFAWTWRAVRFDHRAQYSPAKQAATYLRTLPAMRIAGFLDTETIAPYFDRRLFFNQPTAYHWFSTNDRVDFDAPQTFATHPPLVIASTSDPSYPWIRGIAEQHGYRETHRFCGLVYLPRLQNADACYVFLEPGAGE